MIRPWSYCRIAGSFLGSLCVVGLSGCAQDRESAVRAELGQWLALGDTSYFDSSLECTAGVFALEGIEIRDTIPVVRTIKKGMRLLGEGTAVAFDVPDVSPTSVSEAIMSANLPGGLGILSSGVAAKNCMTDEVQHSYLAALTAADTVLFFDPSGNALAVLDRTHKRAFFARGSV